MNDTLSMLTGLLGGYGKKSGQGQSSVTDSMRQADPLYYGQSENVAHWDDGTTTMGEDTLKRRKRENPNPWEGKTVADDVLAMQRKYPEDSLVAHISPWEADLLSSLGGAGTVNPGTGLLQFGWAGGGGDSDSESGDEGNDGGFHDDRDSGYDGGDGDGDQSGWGGKFSREGSSYGGSGSREASAASSDRFNADVTEQGPIGRQFQGAYQSGMAMAPQANTVSENMDALSPVERSTYFGNVSALDEGPFGKETGLVRDNTPTSRAGSMFSQAQKQQLMGALNLGSTIDQGLMSAGYNTSPPTDVLSKAQVLGSPVDDTYDRYFNTDWSRFNNTTFQGSTPQNAMSNQAFADYVSNSPVAAKALGTMRDMELAGKDISGMSITSGNQGGHKPNSKHKTNEAVDVNTKGNQNSFANFTSAMEKAGYNRGDKLGFGVNERMHFQ
jgi:hypothetical protein